MLTRDLPSLPLSLPRRRRNPEFRMYGVHDLGSPAQGIAVAPDLTVGDEAQVALAVHLENYRARRAGRVAFLALALVVFSLVLPFQFLEGNRLES